MEKILLDVHAHLIPAAETGLAAFEGVVWDEPSGKFAVDGHAVGISSLFKPLDLLEWMDRNQVEHAWISVPPPVYRPQLDRSNAARWVAALNDGLSVIAAAHPLRLTPLFHLPVEHPELAAGVAAEKIAKGHTRFSMAAGGTKHVLSAASMTQGAAARRATERNLGLGPKASAASNSDTVAISSSRRADGT